MVKISTSVLPIPRYVEITELVKIYKEAIDVNVNLDTNLIQLEKLAKTSMNVQILLTVEKGSVEILRVVFRYNTYILFFKVFFILKKDYNSGKLKM